MSRLIDNIKSYFAKKESNDQTENAPIGMCPICWGHNEWDGQYYEVIKDKHSIPGKDIYESFISKIADEHVNTSHQHEDKYICTTCDKEI